MSGAPTSAMRSIQSTEVAGTPTVSIPSADADPDSPGPAGPRMAEPARCASQYIGPTVTGLETRVPRAAAGRFARSRIAPAAANGICATGTMSPKNTPSAAPVATVLRFRCHSHSRSSRGPSQRSARLLRASSRVGIRRCSLCASPFVHPDRVCAGAAATRLAFALGRAGPEDIAMIPLSVSVTNRLVRDRPAGAVRT